MIVAGIYIAAVMEDAMPSASAAALHLPSKSNAPEWSRNVWDKKHRKTFSTIYNHECHLPCVQLYTLIASATAAAAAPADNALQIGAKASLTPSPQQSYLRGRWGRKKKILQHNDDSQHKAYPSRFPGFWYTIPGPALQNTTFTTCHPSQPAAGFAPRD